MCIRDRTNGLDELTVLTLSRRTRLTLASFLLGFGGLAVQFQVRALAETHDLPVRGLFAAKLLHEMCIRDRYISLRVYIPSLHRRLQRPIKLQTLKPASEVVLHILLCLSLIHI